jgi:hypothetical protein
VQSNPASHHEKKAWQSGGVHVRVFGIDIEQCARCGGRLKVIASIEDPELISTILTHRRERGEDVPTSSLAARAPPQGRLF